MIVSRLLDSRLPGVELSLVAYRPALLRSIQLRDWASALLLAQALDVGSERLLITDRRLLFMCIDSRDVGGLEFLLQYTVEDYRESIGPFLEEKDSKWPKDWRRATTLLAYATNSEWKSPQDCLELLTIIAHLLASLYAWRHTPRYSLTAQNLYNLTLSFGSRVMRHFFSFSAMGHPDPESHRLPKYDVVARARGFTEPEGVIGSVLYLLDVIIRDLAGTESSREIWCDTVIAVLESYSFTIHLLWKIDETDLKLGEKRALADSINQMKLGIVQIAETLLRNCVADGQESNLETHIYAEICTAISARISGWRLHGIMAWVLWRYGITSEAVGGQIYPEDHIQSKYLPLGIEAYALGKRLLQTFRLVGELGAKHIGVAVLFAPRFDWPEDTRLAKTIRAWRNENSRPFEISVPRQSILGT